MAHQVLVERVVQSNEHRQRRRAAPPRPPDALPGAGDRARITHQYGGIQATDVDPQFQRARGNDAHEIAFAQPLLDPPPLLPPLPPAPPDTPPARWVLTRPAAPGASFSRRVAA